MILHIWTTRGKELNIFFAIGPCGELVEIVSMKIDKGGIR
jgi:hypothetical protein